MTNRTCRVCRRDLPPPGNRKYCSHTCRNRGRYLPARAKPACYQCQQPCLSVHARYCSETCRSAYHAARSCLACGAVMTPSDTEQHGCIVRTYSCRACDDNRNL